MRYGCVRDAINTHSFYSVKSVFLLKIIGLKSLNSFNLSGFLRNVAVYSEQLTLFSVRFVCQHFVLFSGTVIGFWGVAIICACHSIITAEDLGSSTAQKTEFTSFEYRTWHTSIRISSLVYFLIYVHILAVGVYFFHSPVSRSRIHYFRVHCISCQV